MGYTIANSNQFISYKDGSYIDPSTDILVGKPNSDLLQQPVLSDKDDTRVSVKLILRRKEFPAGHKPDGYIIPDELLNSRYHKQLKFINNIKPKHVRRWYGSSRTDVNAITSYLEQYGGEITGINPEQRTVDFSITVSSFRQAFLDSKPNTRIAISSDKNKLFYFNPDDYADSYLETNGQGARDFSEAVIGVFVQPLQLTSQLHDDKGFNMVPSNSQVEPPTNNQPIRPPSFNYYPLEVATTYGLPSPRVTHSGKGVTVGIIGTGGDNFEEIYGKTGVLDGYLRAQNINPSKIGRLFTPSTPEDFSDTGWYGESSLDYSIVRSVASRSDIVFSREVENTGQVYEGYADLIYNNRVDVISSSARSTQGLDIFNKQNSFNELFLDALLRGKTIVASTGDKGAANNEIFVPKGDSIPSIEMLPSVLTVGGTSYSPEAQKLIQKRPNLRQPTEFAPINTDRILDKLTGLISDQNTWNTPPHQTSFDIQTYDQALDNGKLTLSPQLGGTDFDLKDLIGYDYSRDSLSNSYGSSGYQSPERVAMPSYQSKNLTPEWLGTGRRYPDVSFLASGNTSKNANSDYYALNAVSNQSKTAFDPVLNRAGGTSAAAPLAAALVANLYSAVRKKFGNKAKLGLLNPLLYEIYNSKPSNNVIVDIPEGSNNANVYTVARSKDEWSGLVIGYPINQVNGEPGSPHTYLLPVNGTAIDRSLDPNLFSTAYGFDAATGLGSFHVGNLVTELQNLFSML